MKQISCSSGSLRTITSTSLLQLEQMSREELCNSPSHVRIRVLVLTYSEAGAGARIGGVGVGARMGVAGANVGGPAREVAGEGGGGEGVRATAEEG